MSPLPPGAGAILSLVVDPQNSGTLYPAGDLGDSGFDTRFMSDAGGALFWQGAGIHERRFVLEKAIGGEGCEDFSSWH
jgi:hypothetical protein